MRKQKIELSVIYIVFIEQQQSGAGIAQKSRNFQFKKIMSSLGDRFSTTRFSNGEDTIEIPSYLESHRSQITALLKDHLVKHR